MKLMQIKAGSEFIGGNGGEPSDSLFLGLVVTAGASKGFVHVSELVEVLIDQNLAKQQVITTVIFGQFTAYQELHRPFAIVGCVFHPFQFAARQQSHRLLSRRIAVRLEDEFPPDAFRDNPTYPVDDRHSLGANPIGRVLDV